MSDGNAPAERGTEPSPEDVSWALHQLVVAAAALDVTLGRRLNLGPSEYQAMKHLLTAERPLGPVELGALVGLTSGAATTLVDRLERAGHLARRRDRHDRRRLTLEPTPDALDSARRQLRPLEDALGEILQTYSGEDRRTIARFLGEVVAAYQHFNVGTGGHRRAAR
ncbi:MarR family winged helix-turn-helix transcriptional regulator [Micromonospora andamanensis]|uniref:MarR family winged helix-turn-helix transcriptional regulator n=1 Tax=Micromonospora andamanensis TaxID=1287068 RepID=UPI00194E1900|nr:MarR family winged helix-turn-helix transcriptional regulator [Micromonospora andamanensis]